MSMPTPNWVNVQDNGAVGDGVTDDTAAVQAVLTAAESNANGTVVYFPAGTYMVDGLAYSSSAPLSLQGEGWASHAWVESFTNIQANNPATATAAVHVLDINSATAFTMDGIAVLGAQTATSAYTNDYIGINICGVYYVHISRVSVGHNLNGNMVNTALKTDSGVKNLVVDDFASWSNLYGYWMNGSIQCSLRNANVGTTQGAGGAGFYMSNGAATLRLTNCQTDLGDVGLLMSANGGANPAFIFLNDVEFNNYGTYGMQLNNGGQVWANQCWFSGTGTPGGYPLSAVVTGTAFTGIAYFTQCSFEAHKQHTVLLQAGSGYGFTNCIFGYGVKQTANTYDELHVGTVSNLSVTGCHFNVDPNYGIGAQPPRSAIWTAGTANNVGVCNCICASSGYGDGNGHGGSTGIGVWTGNLGGW